ncbi:MAG: hypothetical protein ACKVXR_17465 [Planctomycetota bacterium]
MRFITVSAAILIGSAMSAVYAQQVGSAADQGTPAKQLPVKGAPSVVAHQSTGGSGSIPVVSGATDSCIGATMISGPGNFIGDNIGAADVEDADTTCRSLANEANDVWYEWTAGGTGVTFMSMCPAFGGGATASFDTLLTVFANAACAGAQIACNDDGPGCTATYQSTTSFASTAGAVYKIQIAGWAVAEEGTFNLRIDPPVVAPPNNTCATAIAITGMGPFAGTTVNATTDGVAGACGQAGQDVWYNWTSCFTGSADATFCAADGASAAHDSIAYVYAGVGCAPVGATLGCNDDFCGLQSKVTFAATAGSVHKIRVGGFGTATGAFSMKVLGGPVLANDSCATPAPYLGGVMPWTNVCATTDGGAESCGTPNQDVWYLWNSTFTGAAQFSLCGGGTAPDTILAVYAGSGCPTAGTAIACDDDACPGLTSVALACSVVSGQDYLIRIGGFGGASGSGTLEVTQAPSAPEGTCATYDDSTTENSVGFGAAGFDILWMHTHGVAGQTTVVKAINTAWGSPLFGGGNGPPNFSPARVAVWQDVDQDGIPGNNPGDAVELTPAGGVIVGVQGTDTDVKQNIPLPTPLLITGTYFIGVSSDLGTFPAPLDQSSGSCPGSKAWIVGSTTGPINYAALETAGLPPSDVNDLGFPGYWLLDPDCKDLDIDEICGVVVSAAVECPCAPLGGLVGNGCPHSGAVTGSDGAHLAGSGQPLLAPFTDTLSVLATNVRQGNGAISLFLQGDNDPQVPFNDGLICSSNNILKLWLWKDPVGPAGSGGGITSQTGPGASTIPPTTSISQRSSDLGSPILNGQTRVYTMAFRDPSVTQGCPSPSTVNTTNGVKVLWSGM